MLFFVYSFIKVDCFDNLRFVENFCRKLSIFVFILLYMCCINLELEFFYVKLWLNLFDLKVIEIVYSVIWSKKYMLF